MPFTLLNHTSCHLNLIDESPEGNDIGLCKSILDPSLPLLTISVRIFAPLQDESSEGNDNR